MLNLIFSNQLYLGIAQAVVTALLAIVVMTIARLQEIHIENEVLIALLRGFVQVVAVGSIIVLLLQGPSWTSVFLLPGG
jgi:putative ABC transport system permease protein